MERWGRSLSFSSAILVRRNGWFSGRDEIGIAEDNVALEKLHAVAIALAGNCGTDFRFHVVERQGFLTDHFVDEMGALRIGEHFGNFSGLQVEHCFMLRRQGGATDFLQFRVHRGSRRSGLRVGLDLQFVEVFAISGAGADVGGNFGHGIGGGFFLRGVLLFLGRRCELFRVGDKKLRERGLLEGGLVLVVIRRLNILRLNILRLNPLLTVRFRLIAIRVLEGRAEIQDFTTKSQKSQ